MVRYSAPVPWPETNEALIGWLMAAPDGPEPLKFEEFLNRPFAAPAGRVRGRSAVRLGPCPKADNEAHQGAV